MPPQRLLNALIVLNAALALGGCRSLVTRASPPPPIPNAPYPTSRAITAVSWDFSPVTARRRALGSDLWPCTWAGDGNQYCAWGDGGGFDGNDDQIGRVSLGFARISGEPAADGSLTYTGKNVWGAPPYAENPATFGGKVASVISVDGVLYAIGALWTSDNSADPVHASERGPRNTLVWSTDLARSWHVAPWSTATTLGTFLNFGRDNRGAFDRYIYIYYVRADDRAHVFLKRVAKQRLQADPAIADLYQFLSHVDHHGRAAWSTHESEASAIFADPNLVDDPEVVYDAKLHRYLLTVGHNPSGDERESSIGKVGLFEAPKPWGPWATIGYYEDWGAFGASAAGDYLGLHLPAKWMGSDGKTLWCVFSGLHQWDSFNVARASVKTR